MESAATILAALPTEICGCRIEHVLTENHSWLAVGPGGRPVVLKRLDPDCLIEGSLHPIVRDRLARVRELAHASVANLFGVEREGKDAYLMWEYVEGIRLDAYAGANHSEREVASILREMVLAVDLLHMQGIVHGALIGSNAIVTPGGAVRLTHLSPLIYTDPNVDVECVWNLIEHSAEQLGERGTALAGIVAEGRQRKLPLRQLATRLGPLIESRDAKKPVQAEVKLQSPSRRRTLLWAAAVLAAGMGLAGGAWYAIESGRISFPQTLHRPFHSQGDR